MINFNNVMPSVRAVPQLLTTHAPAILTAFGAVGVVGTAVLTTKATFEAADIIQLESLDRLDDMEGSITSREEMKNVLTKTEKAKLVWTLYIPAVSTGTLSVAAIIMSNRISSKRAAVLAAAYALNQDKLEEYQDKVKEKFGIKKEKETRDELAQDKVNRDYDEGTVIFSPLDGKVLIRDDYSGRFFWSSIDEVNKAVNDINYEILAENYVRLSEFYDLLGLDHVSTSDHVGWNVHERCQIDWSTTTTPDLKTPCHSFEFVNPPILNPGDGASFR